MKLCQVTEHVLYCIVNGVFLRNIHSDERLIGTPSKEVLPFCLSATDSACILKMLVLLRRQKRAVLFYASLTNYTPLETQCH